MKLATLMDNDATRIETQPYVAEHSTPCYAANGSESKLKMSRAITSVWCVTTLSCKLWLTRIIIDLSIPNFIAPTGSIIACPARSLYKPSNYVRQARSPNLIVALQGKGSRETA